MSLPADLIDLISAASDSVQSFTETDVGKVLVDGAKAAKGNVSKYAPNPHMVQNGHAEKSITGDDCPKCRKYFRVRTLKKVGGSLFSGAGSLASSSTGGVNVTGALRHGRAEVKTIAHLVKLGQQAKTIKQSQFLCKLIAVIISMKSIKAINQGGALAADLIFIFGVFAVNSVMNRASRATAKGMSAAVKWASVELHWRAFQEMKLAGPRGSGPAMRMVRELFNQAFFKFPWESGALAADQYILEPAGWMVIQDKLNLI
ncbi:MAG TPA: hypothetical protein VHX44_07995 [Planctomycetota bacterium]|nr:hypothetical protein [Planctomycetota bacterium]